MFLFKVRPAASQLPEQEKDCAFPHSHSSSSPSPSAMCRGPRNLCSPPAAEAVSLLLELSAADDLAAFKLAVEETDFPLDASAPWYSRSVAPASSPSRRMKYELRSPLEISALYGSTAVLSYILNRQSAGVNRPCGSDGATALHCAAAGGSAASLLAAKLLIAASADVNAADATGNRPGDVIAKQPSASMARELEALLKSPCPRVSSPSNKEKKEYPPDSTLPDIKNGIYGTDEFRMYALKVKPCSRAYSHDWAECPFVHPGENARRRDPLKYPYSCVPCPEFRRGSCPKADSCEYAHGVFESWLHPAQYRTRLCKDEIGCNRRICFFAHRRDELRTVNPTIASISGLGFSPPKMSQMAAALMMSSPAMGSSSAWKNRAAGIFAGNQMKQQQLISGYASNLPSSFDPDLSIAKAILSSRLSSSTKRSQSFIDREVASPLSIGLSDWASPDGKLDWGIHGDELTKLRKSATFNLRGKESWPKAPAMAAPPVPLIGLEQYQKQYQSNGAGDYLPWEPLVA